MTQEDKDLLLKDLCARLPYGVICDRLGKLKKLLAVYPTKKFPLHFDNGDYKLEDIKPYLRPMSSMTEEERKDFPFPYYCDWIDISKGVLCSNDEVAICLGIDEITSVINYLNAHHFDYRGLIPMGLALEAPEVMYTIK